MASMGARSYALEPVDPIDEEIAALLAHPEVRADLEEDEASFERGDYLADVVPHAEVRRRLGMEPEADTPTA